MLKTNNIKVLISISIVVLFVSSVLRHELFNSSGDLAFFDQAIYLISQGKQPISSIIGFHALADHAAWIIYPLSLLYKIYPSVYWLLLIQSIALALGGLPTYYLALQANLKENLAVAIVFVYLLYPVIYNSNLCDFHPDTIAVPALLMAVLAARKNKIVWFCICILLVLGCKSVLSLTVVAMGVWLLFFEKRRLFGLIAIISGITWFLIASSIIIPIFGGEAALLNRHFYRYSYLGNSFSEMIQILMSQPGRIFSNIFSLINLEYLIFLIFPVIWGLSPKYITPLIGALPCVAMNLLADHPTQKNLVLHYSLPAIPFIILALIASLEAGKSLIKRQKTIILWSLVWFLILGKFWFFGSKYLHHLDNWLETREAIALVKTKESVLTTDIITPHLTHRQLISFKYNPSQITDVNNFNYILLNTINPGWAASSESLDELANYLKNESSFELTFAKNHVYLFHKRVITKES